MSNGLSDKCCNIVSKRWAKALLELVQEGENVSGEDILHNLEEIADTIESSEKLSNVINNPAISVEEKQVVVSRIFKNSVMPIVYNFVHALTSKNRLCFIKEIAKEFKSELDIYKNVAHVEITSAIDLSEDRKNDIKFKLSEKLKKNIIVNWSVDKDVIAGLVFNINDTIIDNSVRHKLEDLKKKIIKN